MPPELAQLEERITALEHQPLRYPLDATSRKVLFSAMDKRLIEFLHPQDTDDANDGAFIALNNTPAIQFADAATKVAYFSFVTSKESYIARMEFVWSTPATSGNLRWQVDIGEGGDSDTNNVRTTGGTAVSTAADGVANELNFTD